VQTSQQTIFKKINQPATKTKPKKLGNKLLFSLTKYTNHLHLTYKRQNNTRQEDAYTPTYLLYSSNSILNR